MRRAKFLAVRTVVALAFAIKVHITVFLTIFHFTSSTHAFNLSVIGRNYNIGSKKVLESFYGDVSPDVESRCV